MLLATVQTVSPQEVNKVGTSAATFLRIPVGARALSMGNAFVSMKDDPAGLSWNPSILSSVSSMVLVVDHAQWMPGIDFDFVGFVLPLREGETLGLSTTILHTDAMEVTTPQEQMGTGETFMASSIALGVSYSRSLTDRFSIGGTFKYIRETIFNTAASGIAFDIGTIFETPFAGIRFGASISNFGSKMRMDGEDLNFRADIAPNQEGNNQSVVGRLNTDEFDLPLIMRIGISGEVLQNEDVRVTVSADGINPNDNAQSVNCGGEVGLLNELLRFRAGYRDLFLDENEFGPTFGISLHDIEIVGGVTITTEYAFQQYNHLGESSRFTLGIRF
ncbi:MAG: PorV/PorQ family protein [Bacteroidota bacterium]